MFKVRYQKIFVVHLYLFFTNEIPVSVLFEGGDNH